MSHMVETMAYTGEVPWHGLGKPVSADLTPEEMLKESGNDWEVEKRPIFTTVNGDRIVVPGREALIRTSDGSILDVVGEDWLPLQNSEAFAFFQEFVESGNMEMHTAGSLDRGRRVWALAKTTNKFAIFGDDEVEQYLLLSNPHKYGMSIDVRTTDVRVVCNNTITFALNSQSAKMVKINHRSAFDADLVKETLGVAKEKLEAYKEAAQFLGKKKYTINDLGEYFRKVFPKTTGDREISSRNALLAQDVINNQPGAEFGKGSWWQAFNAVTYMTDHLYGRGIDSRLTSAWYGENSRKKTKALKLALDFADKSKTIRKAA